MGHRTIKRVPLDFDWPLDKRWQGYLNPHYRKCPSCEGGYGPGYKELEALVRLILLAGESATSGKPPHPYLRQWGIGFNAPLPKELAAVASGLAEREPFGPFGYDSVAAWVATKKIVAAAGLDAEAFSACQHCGGHGVDPEVYATYEAWEPSEPPAGDGWQMWETTSEGSPQTPVFRTPEELARYCAEHATIFGSESADYPTWFRLIAGKGDLETGSLMIARPGYVGVLANEPLEKGAEG